MKSKSLYILISVLFLISIGFTVCNKTEFTYYETEGVIDRGDEKSDITKITTERHMNTDLIVIILTSLGVIAAIIFNPKMNKISYDVRDVKNDIKQFKDETNDKFKKLQVKQDLEASLREISEGVLEITSGELSGFINFESELFIGFAKEVINGSFNVGVLPSIKTKLHGIKYESNMMAKKFGEEFFELHHKSQLECVDKFYKGIEETLMDDVFNTKHKRFRMLCEQFMHGHLTDSVKNYMKTKGRV